LPGRFVTCNSPDRFGLPGRFVKSNSPGRFGLPGRFGSLGGFVKVKLAG
jgi:hypothetical protein